VTVIPFGGNEFSIPSQERVWSDEGFKLIQHLTPEHKGLSGRAATFGIGEAKPTTAQALLEHAVLFLEILDHIQLMVVDPTDDSVVMSHGLADPD
jgi:hypothetical protein